MKAIIKTELETQQMNKSWVGLELTGSDDYGNAKCTCGHSAIQHTTVASVMAGRWQCERVTKDSNAELRSKWLGCCWHEFIAKND